MPQCVSVLAATQQNVLQLPDVLLVDAARGRIELLAEISRRACRSAHLPSGLHELDARIRDVGRADVPPRHHEILYVARVETAEGDRIRLGGDSKFCASRYFGCGYYR